MSASRSVATKGGQRGQIIGRALGDQFSENRKLAGRRAGLQAPAQPGLVRLHHVEERTGVPSFGFDRGGVVLVGHLAQIRPFAVPLEIAALEHRVQGVEAHQNAQQRQAGVHGAAAEAVQQSRLVPAGQSGRGRPRDER
jgi:hypothetical protein